MTDARAAERARAYYRALDEGDYEALAGLLAPEFVHERPDRTLSGRDRFIRFMREERPDGETTHEVDRVYDPAADADRVAVQGRLLAADGDRITRFVDVFAVSERSIVAIETYTR